MMRTVKRLLKAPSRFGIGRMAELQQLNEFISQNSSTERTIKCTPEGISFTTFADVCERACALEGLKESLQLPLSVLRSASQNDDKRMESASSEIVAVLLANATRCVTLEQYVWLTRATIAANLLKGLPCDEPSPIKRLNTALEDIELALHNHSPLVIHLVTKALIEDIPLQGVNLLHVIKILGMSLSPIHYYVAVSLVFAGLGVITNAGSTEYRLHTVDEFLSFLERLTMEQLHKQRSNLQNIYQLLKLISLYENLVILRHIDKLPSDLESEHKGYAPYFCVTEQHRMALQLWLEKSSALVHLFGNDRDMDYLILADLIQVDMLPLLDDVNPSTELL